MKKLSARKKLLRGFLFGFSFDYKHVLGTLKRNERTDGRKVKPSSSWVDVPGALGPGIVESLNKARIISWETVLAFHNEIACRGVW